MKFLYKRQSLSFSRVMSVIIFFLLSQNNLLAGQFKNQFLTANLSEQVFSTSIPPTVNPAPPEVCTEKIEGLPFSASTATTTTVIQPATTYGFMFDIYKLDNSFTLTINGTPIANKEIEFQSAGTEGVNIRFADGSKYEGGVGTIYSLTGTPAAPLLRVAISPTGVVTMFGSKVSGGPLFPLELFNGAEFKNVTWNKTMPNTTVISQKQVGPTNISGQGFGLNEIPCICFNPANTATPGQDTKVGITLFNRAGSENTDNWPMTRKSGHLALESNTKGFVVSRIAKADLGNIAVPQEGMMVFDTTDKCLKIYSDGEWSCFSTPTCP